MKSMFSVKSMILEMENVLIAILASDSMMENVLGNDFVICMHLYLCILYILLPFYVIQAHYVILRIDMSKNISMDTSRDIDMDML